MFGQRLTLFRIFGIPLRIDLSWIFVAFLVSWSLAVGYFPERLEGLGRGAAWGLGVAGMLGLFGSVLLHELGHALVGRRVGMEFRGITLFIFGGLAEMSDEPADALSEFWMAIGGPAVSLVLALGFGLLSQVTLLPALDALIVYLAAVNGILLVFNMIPAFPLDGGRVLRALLWKRRGSLRSATKTASTIGGVFGYGLIGFGVFQLLGGALVGAIWAFLIGLFIRHAAQMSYQQVLLRRLLEGEPIERFMTARSLVTIPAQTRLDTVAEDYFFSSHHKLYPVVEGERYVGVVTAERLRTVPREDWSATELRTVAVGPGPGNTLDARTDAMEVLSRMNRNQISRMVVARDERVLGIITLKDLLRFLALKIELEEGDSRLSAKIAGAGT